MSTPAAVPADTPVRITRYVREFIEGMGDTPARSLLVRYIRSIGDGDGEPIDIPGAPPGTQYLALTPPSPSLPIIVYRPALPEEGGGWIVITLLDKETYELQRAAERSGLLSDPAVRRTIESAAHAAAGTISTAVGGPIVRPITPEAPGTGKSRSAR